MDYPIKALSLLVFSALLLSGCSQSEFSDSTGKAFSMKDDQGRWTALNIWAEWCEPCRDEIPELNALDQEGKVRVVGYDFDGSQEKELNSKIERMGIEFRVLPASPLVKLETGKPRALPATLLLNPEGKLVDTLLGPQDRMSIRSKIQALQTKKG